jgi:actin beta/gamma 1
MFEENDVPALFIQIQAVLSLYAAGRMTGIVVDSGDGVTHTVPIFEGYQIPHAIKKVMLAGRDMTDWMQKILQDAGINLVGGAEREIVRDMKEKKCYVALDYQAEVEKANSGECDTEYTLPDHTVVTFGVHRFRTPELIFNPSIDGRNEVGVGQLTYDSIQACDIDVRKDLFGNIILSGGSTMYEGYAERLQKEVKNKCAATMKVKIFAAADRKFMVWKGGSTLVSLANF